MHRPQDAAGFGGSLLHDPLTGGVSSFVFAPSSFGGNCQVQAAGCSLAAVVGAPYGHNVVTGLGVAVCRDGVSVLCELVGTSLFCCE